MPGHPASPTSGSFTTSQDGTAPAISGHNRFNMIDQFPLGLGAAIDAGGPGRHTAIPGQRMTADIDLVLPGKIHQRIGFFEPVFPPRRMDVRPLHLAFGTMIWQFAITASR